MKTYTKVIDGNEVIVTDSLIVAKEFGLRHDNLLKKARKVASEILSDSSRTPESSGVLFVESSYINDQSKEQPKVILGEQAFYYLVMEINHAKGKEQRELLSKIKRDFVDDFFRLREQNKLLSKLGEIFIKYFAPIDELGKTSFFNGKKRLYIYRGYLSTKKNDRPMTDEIEDVMLDGFLSEDIIKETVKTVNRHETNKKGLQKTKYVPSSLYLLLKEKGLDTLKKIPFTKPFSIFQ